MKVPARAAAAASHARAICNRPRATSRRTATAEGDPNGADGDGSKKSSGGGGAGPQKVRTGSDDDIVAKRLRKAAEEETDPELKERLWKEYNDYKKATG